MDDNKQEPTIGNSQGQDPWTSGPRQDGGAGKQKQSGSEPESSGAWERDVLNRLAFASFNEQRRARRWGIFFKSLTALYFTIFLIALIPSDLAESTHKGKHVALIEVEGVIAADADASADNVITGLRDAYDNKDVAGVILRINSPGGSPVQAGYVVDEMNRLRASNAKLPVYAVITDVGASGGYYIASAADQIYVDKASIVGSIGVTMSPFGLSAFGFTEAMKKMGIERRLITSGDSKSFLDPFSAKKPQDEKHIKGLLNSIHQQFIDVVKAGRGDRLANDPSLFTGLIWTGEQGVELGLVDGLGSSSYVARDLIKVERIINYTPKANYLDRFADRLGVVMINLLSKLELN